jgi:hypothetical protein
MFVISAIILIGDKMKLKIILNILITICIIITMVIGMVELLHLGYVSNSTIFILLMGMVGLYEEKSL